MSERDREKPAPDSEDQQWTEDAERAPTRNRLSCRSTLMKPMPPNSGAK